MKSVARWSLWQKRWSAIWWSLGILAYNGINLGLYPAFKNQAAEFQKAMENIPESALQFLGGSSDFLSPVGFLNSKVYYMMLPLMLCILAIGLGSSLVAKEEQDGTIELLLSRPLKRHSLLAGKALAGSAILSIVSCVTCISLVLIAAAINLGIGVASFISSSFMCLLLALCFGAIAFTLSSTGKAKGASIGISSALAVMSYAFTSLSSTVQWLEWPSKVLPFHYYHPEALLRGSSLRITELLYFLVVVALLGGIANYYFNKRDIV